LEQHILSYIKQRYFIKLWALLVINMINTKLNRGCGGRDHMVVGFTTTYAISAYHHWCCEFGSRSGRGVQNYVIKFVSDLQQVGGFLRVLSLPPSIKQPWYNWNIVETNKPTKLNRHGHKLVDTKYQRQQWNTSN
jgi:hypothetical protein